MVIISLRIVTFLTNLIILISFIWLTVSIQRSKRTSPLRRHATGLTVAITIAYLLFFHIDSLLNIANAGHPVGYGWTFLNFQIATILYAVLATHTKAMLTAMLAVTGSWFVWMDEASGWLLGGFCLIMLALGYHYQAALATKHWLYYPYGWLLAIPAYMVNYQSLGGIDVGWPLQIVGFFVLEIVVWLVNWLLNTRALKEAALRKEATVDPLTQLANFGQFDHDLQAAFTRYQATHERYSLYTFDIDHFKQINDQFGHLAGNEVLRVFANHLHVFTHNLEYPAKVYRTGGEEFSILLFNIPDSPQLAVAIAGQLRQELNNLTFVFDDTELHLTISLGQDRATGDDKNYLDLYRRADAFLYSSKESGRDAATIRGQLVR